MPVSKTKKSKVTNNDKIKRARNKADRKFQEICAVGYCQLCGKPVSCCHHIIEKSLSNRLRYDLKNGLRVCHGCHYLIHSKADPALFRKIDEAIGEERVRYLEEHRRDLVNANLKWYQDSYDNLEKQT